MHDGRPTKRNSRSPFPNSPSLPQTRLRATRPFPMLQPRALSLGEKARQLISIAVAVTTRCDSCITIHTDLALKAGATKQEIAEALGVAMAMNERRCNPGLLSSRARFGRCALSEVLKGAYARILGALKKAISQCQSRVNSTGSAVYECGRRWSNSELVREMTNSPSTAIPRITTITAGSSRGQTV